MIAKVMPLDLGKELWEKVKDPLSRCSDDEVERFLSSVQEGVLEYSRKVPKETEESKFDAKADSCKVWFGGRWIVLRKPSRATSDIGEGPLDVDATFEGMHTEVIALEKHRTGQVVSKDEAQEYCQMHGIRIISTRWVVVNKHDAIKGPYSVVRGVEGCVVLSSSEIKFSKEIKERRSWKDSMGFRCKYSILACPCDSPSGRFIADWDGR